MNLRTIVHGILFINLWKLKWGIADSEEYDVAFVLSLIGLK